MDFFTNSFVDALGLIKDATANLINLLDCYPLEKQTQFQKLPRKFGKVNTMMNFL